MKTTPQAQTEVVAWTSPAAWSKSYETLACACRAISDRWLQSRTEGVRTALEVFGKLAQCRDQAEAAKLQQDWLKATIDRFNAEMTDYQKEIMGLSRESVAVLEQGLASRATSSVATRAA
jgi:hypothetical protein